MGAMNDERDAVGLRERKKRATQLAIERTAIELALEHGYENVTVEMICDAVTISQRTFFNYAGSKERAVLGIDPPTPGAELSRAFVAGLGGSPLQDLVATIAAAFSDSGATDASLFRKRRSVLEANPALALREFARMEEAQATIIDLVRARLIADEPDRDARDAAAEARMTVSVAFGIMHDVMRDWIDREPGEDPTEALRRAVELARVVIAR